MAELKVPSMQTDLTAADLDSDFEHLINDPNATGAVAKLLDQINQQRNTFTMAEFRRYEPLFQYDGIRTMGEDAYQTLARDYFHRISLYDPVTVIDGGSVIMKLPPIFDRYNMIGAIGQTGIDVNQAWINANNADDLMSQERQRRYAQYYQQLIAAVNDAELHAQKEADAKNMADNAMIAVQNRQEQQTNADEIQDLSPSHFNSNEIQSLSTDNPKTEPQDEFEPI